MQEMVCRQMALPQTQAPVSSFVVCHLPWIEQCPAAGGAQDSLFIALAGTAASLLPFLKVLLHVQALIKCPARHRAVGWLS